MIKKRRRLTVEELNLQTTVDSQRAIIDRLNEELRALHDKIGEVMLETNCVVSERNLLREDLKLAQITNDAHCTVINDLSQSALNRFNEWLMSDWQERYSALNNRHCEMMRLRDIAVNKSEAYKANAERLLQENFTLKEKLRASEERIKNFEALTNSG